jgi:hypothetical protein
LGFARSALTLGELVDSAGGTRLIAVRATTEDRSPSIEWDCDSVWRQAAELPTRGAAGRADGSSGKDATSRVFGASTAKK